MESSFGFYTVVNRHMIKTSNSTVYWEPVVSGFRVYDHHCQMNGSRLADTAELVAKILS